MSEREGTVTVIETDSIIRPASNGSGEAVPDFNPSVLADTDSLIVALQRQAQIIARLQRKVPKPRVIFRVQMETGGSYVTHRLPHNLGGSVIVRLEGAESSFAGTIAANINYQTDASTPNEAVVHIARSGTGPYVAVIGIEAV